MKKYTLLFVLLIAAVFAANAQSLQIQNAPTTVTEYCNVAFPSVMFDVANITNSDVDVHCLRHQISVVPGSDNSFCWGVLCYPPTTDTSVITQLISAGTVDNTFRGDYFPNGYPGVTTVEYCFFNASNPNDQACVTINYDGLTVGTFNPEAPFNFTITGKNPANTITSFTYSYKEAGKATVKIIDMLGNTLRNIPLSSTKGNMIITTSELPSGVYFLNLELNGRTVAGKKLIVNH